MFISFFFSCFIFMGCPILHYSISGYWVANQGPIDPEIVAQIAAKPLEGIPRLALVPGLDYWAWLFQPLLESVLWLWQLPVVSALQTGLNCLWFWNAVVHLISDLVYFAPSAVQSTMRRVLDCLADPNYGMLD